MPSWKVAFSPFWSTMSFKGASSLASTYGFICADGLTMVMSGTSLEAAWVFSFSFCWSVFRESSSILMLGCSAS
ncbi:hypothetical protein D3C76_1737830 [compost metagenome]